MKSKIKSNFEKKYVKIKKDGEYIDVEIDEEANEERARRIEGLMLKDQLIDIFRDTEFKVGDQKKRIFEKVPFKQLLNYRIKKNNLFF